MLPFFPLLSWLLIKQGGWPWEGGCSEGRVVAQPQLLRADPCHPFRLPLLRGGEQGWGGGPKASSPPVPLPVPARWEKQFLSMLLSHAVSLLLFTPVGMKPSWEFGQAAPSTRWSHQQQ